MTAIVPVLAASVFGAGAYASSRMRSPIQARRSATLASSAALVLCATLTILNAAGVLGAPRVLGLELRWLPEGLLSLAPLVTCTAGLLALAMSPIVEGLPRILGRIGLLVALALAFLASGDPYVLATLWSLSPWIVWRELRSVKAHHRTARLFAFYQVPSVVLFVTGTIALADGRSSLGASLIVAGIAVREAVLPLHSWFPRFVESAPLGIVVAFSAPQLGVYAQLELLEGTLPFASLLAAVGAVTAVGAAALGLVQQDARRALAYLVISQTGLVAFGLDTESSVARVGALLTWQVLALATSGFAMTLAALNARRGSLSLLSPSGSLARTPRMGFAFLALGFATVGFPMTLGFVAEDLLVQGSVSTYPLLGLSLIVATALNGMSVMRCFFVLFSGRNKHMGEQDLTVRERAALTLVLLALLVGGLFPRYLTGVGAAEHEHVEGSPTHPEHG